MAAGAEDVTVPRKQRARTADWVAALAEARTRRDRARADRLVAAAVERLREVTEGIPSAYSWSGGKDSQVAALVAREAGVTEGLCVLTAGLEYPAFTAWVFDNLPPGCRVHTRPHDLPWLKAHPCWLFPESSARASRWFGSIQHAGQRGFMNATDTEVMVMGRRVADGNHCGPDGVYRDPRGFLRVSPLYDWSHEDVLCVIACYDLPLAPCYGWPDGWRVATGPWPKRRRRGTLADTWATVRSIDPSVVEAAARFDIPGARAALA